MKKLPVNKVSKQETEEFVEEVDSDEEVTPSIKTEKTTNVQTPLPSTCKNLTHEDQKNSTNEIVSSNCGETSDKKNTLSSMKVCKETQEPATSMSISNEETPTTEKDESLGEDKVKKVYGPMRPPADYVIPDSYFDQETDRDLPEITDETDT